MEIKTNGVDYDTPDIIMSKFTDFMQKNCGSDFTIRKDGVLAGFFEEVIKKELSLQAAIKYLITQYNPDTAEGRWQDGLYERIGVSRLSPQTARITAKIEGYPGCKVKAKEVLIKSDSGTEFENSSDFVIDEDGFANIGFEAVEFEEIDITNQKEFKILRAPYTVLSIDNSSVSVVFEGRVREQDSDYRDRYNISKANNSRATSNANFVYLSNFVENPVSLKILDKNSDASLPVNSVKIIAKPNVSDIDFAEAIMNTFGVGISFVGTTSVILQDIKGTNVTVKFCKANDIPIFMHSKIKIKDGYFADDVINHAKLNILQYVSERNFGLDSTVYSSEFLIPLLRTEGISSAEEIFIKSSSDSEYSDKVNCEIDEEPVFNFDNISFERM